MNIRSFCVVAVTLLAAVSLTIVLAPIARSQVQATPSYIPIGVSSTGNASTVWFHEPYSRQAMACQTVTSGGNLSAIQCVAGKLP